MAGAGGDAAVENDAPLRYDIDFAAGREIRRESAESFSGRFPGVATAAMVATNEGKGRNGRARSQSRPRKPRGADTEPAATLTAADGPQSDRPSRPRGPDVPTVNARDAARHIRRIAEVGDTLEGRNRLRQLAALVKQGGRDTQRMSFIETAIGECLDEATQAASPVDRWLASEAATWALAWMARTKRAGGSAGGLLERLVGQARVAGAELAAGDTLPARFVLTLARLFRDVEACRCLEEGASATLVSEIERLVAADGMIHAVDSAAMIDRVVRWTRARETALATGGAAWDAAVEKRWKAAATAAVRLLGTGGRVLAGAGQMPECFSTPLLDALEEVGGRRGRTVRAMRRGATVRGRGRPRGLLPRDLHDPAAAVAVIRSGWDSDAVRVMIDYRHAIPRLEVAVGDRLLVAGPWRWQASLNGRPLEAEGPWTVSGFESDGKATFLEIVASLAGGLQLERQVVMLPRDRVVLLADAITVRNGGAATAARLAYRGTLPLAASLDAEPAEETREIVVFDTQMRFMALPLALPEWRVGRQGSFEASADGLVLAQESPATRLHAPLWLDCDAGRVGGPLTWRHLTVADTRVNLPPHQAVGYRVQAGLEQWLLYRALDVPRNRTLLGCNVSCEFLLGRVKKSGEVARTLEIQ